MIEEFDYFPSVLSIYMFSQLTVALEDLTASGQKPPPDLFERFMEWTLPRATP